MTATATSSRVRAPFIMEGDVIATPSGPAVALIIDRDNRPTFDGETIAVYARRDGLTVRFNYTPSDWVALA